MVAKSRFWYFLRQLKKVRKVNGEILRLTLVCLLSVISTSSAVYFNFVLIVLTVTNVVLLIIQKP